ncbi:hypothetical protein AQUCO_00200740v1 [Aquilegia coerulea]|uniref:F-box domain-containing protein n=1 Tax=Aquilegia coerulea TaxID=218851 RepID=A0A2G5F4H9_AQUCA|nr:hypothetical protein AQUCO_00200740v1 [Aquilegia coerulea]
MVRKDTLLAKRKKKKQEKKEKKRGLALSCVCAEVGICCFDLLPFEIISEVLFKLPIEDIVRCKSVCQTWYNLISDSDFIKSQMERAFSQPRRILLAPYFKHRTLYTTRPNTFFLINKKKCMKISDPYIDLSYSYKIAGSCNGLLCLVSDSDEPVLIYNPITRESQTLPKQCYRKFRYDGPLYGLGYDSFSQKYKVVCVYNTYKKLYNEEMTVGEIISEGEACWRKLEIPFQIQFEGMPETVFVNEAFHWIIDRDYQYSRGNSCPELILALNICDEKFHTFKFPPVEFPDSLSLLNFEESLAIAEYNRLGSEARVWKIVGTGTYDQLLYPYTCKFESVGCYHRVVGMLSDGSFVYKAEKRVSFDWYTRLALYNPEEKQSLIFKLCYFNNTSHVDNTIHTVLFTPTLVSPKTIYFPSNPYPGELEECQSESESDGWRSWFSFYVKGSDSESDESVSSNFSMKYILRKGQAVRKRRGRKGRRKEMET